MVCYGCEGGECCVDYNISYIVCVYGGMVSVLDVVGLVGGVFMP